MESIVETWLEKNSEWFKAYTLRSLDIQTVQSWLKLNNENVCDCQTNATVSNGLHLLALSHKNKLDTEERSLKLKSSLKKCTVNFLQNEMKNSGKSISLHNRINRSKSFTTTHRADERRVPLVELSKKNGKFRAPNFEIDKINSKKSPMLEQCIQLNLNDDPIDTDKELLTQNQSLSFNPQPNNLISLNMVKRSNLIAMRKYNTIISSNSQSLDQILDSSKRRLFQNIANHQLNNQIKSTIEKKYDPEFLVEIIKDISNESDLRILSKKIVKILELIIEADDVSLFFIERNRQSLTAANENNPTIFSYISDKNSDSEMKAIVDNYFINQVVETGNTLKIEDVQKVGRL